MRRNLRTNKKGLLQNGEVKRQPRNGVSSARIRSLDLVELDVHAGDFVRELDLDAVLHELSAREGLSGFDARLGVGVQLGQLVLRVRVEAGGLDGFGPGAAVALEAEEDGLGLVLGDEREFGRLGDHRAAAAVEVGAVEERTELLVDRDALRDDRGIADAARAAGGRVELDAHAGGHGHVGAELVVALVEAADVRGDGLHGQEVAPAPLDGDAVDAVGLVAAPDLLAVLQEIGRAHV